MNRQHWKRLNYRIISPSYQMAIQWVEDRRLSHYLAVGLSSEPSSEAITRETLAVTKEKREQRGAKQEAGPAEPLFLLQCFLLGVNKDHASPHDLKWFSTAVRGIFMENTLETLLAVSHQSPEAHARSRLREGSKIHVGHLFGLPQKRACDLALLSHSWEPVQRQNLLPVAPQAEGSSSSVLREFYMDSLSGPMRSESGRADMPGTAK